MDDALGEQRPVELAGAVAAAVVGEDALDDDAVGAEEGVGPPLEADGRDRPLAGVDLGVGQPGVSIDG